MGGASAVLSTEVTITWNPAGTPDIIFMTHGDADHKCNKSFVGNGVKVLRIKLVNDQIVTDVLGGFWKGDLKNA